MATAGSRAARRHARRQVRARVRPRLPDRHAGAGPPADPAAPARRAAGLNTAGFVSGYRGSPLGGARPGAVEGAASFLERAHITFQPGPERGPRRDRRSGARSRSTCIPGAKYDGVFAMWYGKGPGVDRCGDVFKHANHAGTSKHGGVLVLAGDDHGAKSSTLPHQSDHMFSAAMIPVLYPSIVQEILDLGLHGWAMSRYSGCWVGFKCVADTVESSASVDVDPDAHADHRARRLPAAAGRPVASAGPIRFLDTEARMQDYKIYAALALLRASTSSTGSSSTRRGRASASSPRGKSYLDVRQALDDLGIDRGRRRARSACASTRSAMPWPLEPEGVRQFAEGLEEILVVEEKRQIVEYQLKEQLYNWRDDVRPRVVGKFDEKGEWVRPHGDWLLPAAVRAHAGDDRARDRAADRAARSAPARDREAQRARRLDQREGSGARASRGSRSSACPYFCSGCPHNTSTSVPEGSRATGRHRLPLHGDLDGPRAPSTFTHMGGEGVPWIGQAPFTDEKHIFANLGDGTYFHSRHPRDPRRGRRRRQHHLQDPLQRRGRDDRRPAGRRPALAGRRSRSQVAAEGVEAHRRRHRRAGQVPGDGYFAARRRDPPPRRARRRAARAARDRRACTVLLYDQTCAAEKRRRRKRGKFPDPAQARLHQRARLRRLRRLRRASRTACRSRRSRPSSAASARSTRARATRTSPASRASARASSPSRAARLRKPAKAGSRRASRRCPSPALPATRRALRHPGHRHRRHRRGHHRRAARHGRAPRGQGRARVLDMTGLAQKNGAVVSHVRIADGTGAPARHAHRRRRGASWCSPATSSPASATRRWRRCRRASPGRSSTPR